jgi:hypothetical protein
MSFRLPPNPFSSRPSPSLFGLTLLIGGFALVFASCEAEPLASEVLAGSDSKAWRLEGIITDGIEEFLNPCEATFTLVFSADGSWSAGETGEDCSPTTDSGTWTMNSVGAEIDIEGSTGTDFWRVLELTEERLRILRQEGGLDQEQRSIGHKESRNVHVVCRTAVVLDQDAELLGTIGQGGDPFHVKIVLTGRDFAVDDTAPQSRNAVDHIAGSATNGGVQGSLFLGGSINKVEGFRNGGNHFRSHGKSRLGRCRSFRLSETPKPFQAMDTSKAALGKNMEKLVLVCVECLQ